VAVDALSDHLLALRALLDADEPSSERVAARLAALCAQPPDRPELAARIEQAFGLEKLLMRGEVDRELLEAAGWGSPDELALEVEQSLRAVLRDMVCGYLEPDLRRIADEFVLEEVGAAREDESSPEPEPAPKRAPAPEPEIAVTKAPPKRRSAGAGARFKPEGAGTAKGGKPREGKRTRATPANAKSQPDEQPTEEAAAVGAFGESWTDLADLGFDDPGDFSAAV
jgi:hypothetical protein